MSIVGQVRIDLEPRMGGAEKSQLGSLNDRVPGCLLEFFWVWPAAMKCSTQMQSPWPGRSCHFPLILERAKVQVVSSATPSIAQLSFGMLTSVGRVDSSWIVPNSDILFPERTFLTFLLKQTCCFRKPQYIFIYYPFGKDL